MSVALLDASAINASTWQVDHSDLIARGAVFVLGFDVIRERSGRRWATRQDTVKEFVERQFKKYFTAADHLVRLDEVHFLVVQPLQSGFGAQARALKLLTDVLQFFIGSSAPSDIDLSRVLRLGADGVEVSPVEVSGADLARAAAMDWDQGHRVDTDHRSTDAEDADLSAGPIMKAIDGRSSRQPVMLAGDRTYEAMFLVEPVWGIKQRAVVSYRLRPLVFEHSADGIAPANLAAATPGDLVRLDLTVLAEARKLFGAQSDGHRFALHIPIHHASLTLAGARQAVLARLEQMQPASAALTMVVVTGLEEGAPHSQIVALTSALANRCRAVIALAPNLDFRLDRWRDARLSGVAVDLGAGSAIKERLNIRQLSEFAGRLPGVAPALLAYSVSNTAGLLAAWAAGFTHVGGEVIQRYASDVPRPIRLEPIDMYR